MKRGRHSAGPAWTSRVRRRRFRGVLGLLAFLAAGFRLGAEPVMVRFPEGVERGFLTLRALDGRILANGDLIQFATGDRVTSRLVFHFRDGSLQDETTVYSEREKFRLVSDHLLQRGPSFPYPLDVTIDALGGRVTVRHGKEGKEELIDERMALPPDLSNGLTLTLLKNIDAKAASTTLSMLVTAPKPRLVRLVVTRAGVEAFSVGRSGYRATRFDVKVEIGGLAGVLAPLLGKAPKDASVWISEGAAPGFVKSESQFFQGAPLWRIELAAPDYPAGSPSK
jgi:hypothetical protein